MELYIGQIRRKMFGELFENIKKLSGGFSRVSEQDVSDEYDDWETVEDAHIETPPVTKRSGTIKMRFRYIGRSEFRY